MASPERRTPTPPILPEGCDTSTERLRAHAPPSDGHAVASSTATLDPGQEREVITTDLLERLVAMDTTSRSSNLELIAFVEALLDDHQVPHRRVLDPTGTKANLIARIGPAVPGGIVLSGHTDVVPVDGQPWTRDPFTLHAEGGRLYGRGTTDMKGFLASVLAAVPAAIAAPLTRPILLVLTYDEEIGTVGAPSAVDALLATEPRPAAVLIGEPTSMEVVNAHKGVRAFTTIVDGLDGHSSQPQRAANAIVAAARLASHLDDLAAARREAAADPRFDPPYTTVNLATIHGGQAINIVPRRCELTWEYRPVPADDSFAIRDEVERYAAEVVLPQLRAATGVGEITTRTDAVAAALAPEHDGVAEALARELTGYGGPARTVPFGTDGGHFQAAGLSTVVIGPGSIEQAHTPDEWIEVSQLERCDAMLARLIDHLAT
jgi:acetylornithine deacetylase